MFNGKKEKSQEAAQIAKPKTKKSTQNSGKNSQKKYPTKTTINFVDVGREEKDTGKSVIMIGASAAIVALIIALAIVLPYMNLAGKESELSIKEQDLALVKADTDRYPAVLKEYNKFTTGWMTESEQKIFDRQDAVNLVEEEIVGTASIETYSIRENILLINLSNITLETTSGLVNRIEQREDVINAQVTKADRDLDPKVPTKVSLAIYLKGPEVVIVPETTQGGVS